MNIRRNVIATAVLLATIVVAGATAFRYQQSTYAAQTPPAQPVNVDLLGPQVGGLVPDFSAPDQFARTQTLKSIMGPNGAILFFNRSADW